jgi:hypothetical protein
MSIDNVLQFIIFCILMWFLVFTYKWHKLQIELRETNTYHDRHHQMHVTHPIQSARELAYHNEIYIEVCRAVHTGEAERYNLKYCYCRGL